MTKVAPTTRERPIIFGAESIRGILVGRKTQTRRVIRPQPWRDVVAVRDMAPAGHEMEPGDWCSWTAKGDISEHLQFWWRCPYGVPGDRLWVREAWRTWERYSDMVDGVLYRASSDGAFRPIENNRAAADLWVEAHDNGRHGDNWRSPIHMPRWASRLTLHIESVRVERLQSIGERDADAEGTTSHYACEEPTAEREGVHRCDPIGDYRRAWDRIHGKRHPWKSNAWVWVIGFTVVKESEVPRG